MVVVVVVIIIIKFSYRDVLMGHGRGFWFRCSDVCKVLNHFLGILRLTGARLSCTQDGLVLAIYRCKT